MSEQKTGIELIVQERREQIEKHGFTFEKYDKYYVKGELLQAAGFCLELVDPQSDLAAKWPKGWDVRFKNKIVKKSPIGKLIVAGAFLMAENQRTGKQTHHRRIHEIAAEIDRLQKQKS